MGLVRRRLVAETLGLCKSDRRRRKPGTFGWEEPLLRIAHTLSWLLQHPAQQGLSPAKDGACRVRDLLRHPLLKGLGFFSLERAIRAHRPHEIKIFYAPQSSSNDDPSDSVTSWWIAPQRSPVTSPPQRLMRPDDVSEMVYKAPSKYWEDIRKRGIPRRYSSPLLFHTQNSVPLGYEGDYTFIRLDPQKVLDASDFPIYHTRRHNTTPRFHNISTTLTTDAPVVPPSTFKSAIRVTVERFPLMVSPSNLSNDSSTETGGRGREKRRGKRLKEKEKENGKGTEKTAKGKMVILQSGIEALKSLGFGAMLWHTQLFKSFHRQQKEKQREQTRRGEQQETRISIQTSLNDNVVLGVKPRGEHYPNWGGMGRRPAFLRTLPMRARRVG